MNNKIIVAIGRIFLKRNAYDHFGDMPVDGGEESDGLVNGEDVSLVT